jgi:putative oxidoreductase
MRAATGGVLIVHSAATLGADASAVQVAGRVIPGLIGLLLTAGLWTPVAGVLSAVAAGWFAYSIPGREPFWVLEAALGIALALLGPGAWSLDARLFGWKRVDIHEDRVPTPPLD